MSSSEENKNPKKLKKKKYASKFSLAWETDQRFQAFICKSSKGIHFFFCSYCQKDISIENRGIGDVLRHQKSQKHVKIEKERKSHIALNNIPLLSSTTLLQNQVKNAEVRFAAFIAEHNLPFNISSHASDLFKSMFPDSKIATEFKCKKTKTASIIKNILGETSSHEFNVTLQKKSFQSLSTNLLIVKRLNTYVL